MFENKANAIKALYYTGRRVFPQCIKIFLLCACHFNHLQDLRKLDMMVCWMVKNVTRMPEKFKVEGILKIYLYSACWQYEQVQVLVGDRHLNTACI